MNHTTLTFHGGLRTIGGTIISLQYGDSRIIFDFGLVYSPQNHIFDGQIKLRKSSVVRDYLKLGLIPSIDGVYSKEDLPDHSTLISADTYPGNTAILISHLHLDHMGAMGMIDPSVPVYMTEDSLSLYQTLDEIGEGVQRNRSYQSCKYNQPFTVGEISITPIQVDHDVLGACAFHIQTPDGAILYTGDLRMHGAHPERIQSFIQKANEIGFDAVIMEGTTLSSEEELAEETLVSNKALPEDLVTETMIPSKMAEVLKATNGIGIFNIYHRNIDRIRGILQAGVESGRKVVLEAETAQIALNHLGAQNFLVFQSEEIRQAPVPKWQTRLFNKVSTISYKQINQHPDQYFVQNSYDRSLELFDLNVENGIYLHSNGVPLGSFDPAFQNLERVLQLIGLERVLIGTGGHAIPQHLKYIVDELDPATLIPLHSFYPERLKPKNGVQLLPQYGKTYLLSEGKITEQ
ncbi:MBL fold metallo-hydrolase [Fredinandcohnia sp. QZ13]|uniref:MBL fold metallo-hydrolase n=1 Tax=Fredinandcohnia sp. QZ13 TaxID=3073144 RepID=UPI0028534F6E|nr:MBL fold metallo-hydrolase [Fredinandcohnia sp. QZ13]MDR4890442.1 MBL fold metallo-hydrolase [Fredinandcohnia sp. QZ13]